MLIAEYFTRMDTLRDGENRILRLSERLLADHGPEVSVDRICQEAHISKGAFYHHFPSKQQLVLVVLERLTARGELSIQMLIRFLPLARRDPAIATLLRRALDPRLFDAEPHADAVAHLGRVMARALAER